MAERGDIFDNTIHVLSSTAPSGGKLVVCWNREALTISECDRKFRHKEASCGSVVV